MAKFFIMFISLFFAPAWASKVRILEQKVRPALTPSVVVSEALGNTISGNLIANKCIYDSDCLNDLVCKSGQCFSVCKNSKDCKDREFCAQKYKYGEVIPAFFSTTVCVKKKLQNEWMEESKTGLESLQVGWTYLGGEYRDFPLKEENPALCYQFCKDDPSCFSWTYSRSGNHADAPYCFLKSKVGPGSSNSSLISGVISR